jgi:hypothetical protein
MEEYNMNRPFPSFGMILFLGLVWSLVLYLVLRWIPLGISAQQAYGGAVILSSVALTLLIAVRHRINWTTVIYALIVLFLFGTGATHLTSLILGSAAVVGWVRNTRPPRGKLRFALAAELLSLAVAIGLASGIHPGSAIVISLCVWLFYLTQLIPLAVTQHAETVRDHDALRSKFEATRHKVERILAAHF